MASFCVFVPSRKMGITLNEPPLSSPRYTVLGSAEIFKWPIVTLTIVFFRVKEAVVILPEVRWSQGGWNWEFLNFLADSVPVTIFSEERGRKGWWGISFSLVKSSPFRPQLDIQPPLKFVEMVLKLNARVERWLTERITIIIIPLSGHVTKQTILLVLKVTFPAWNYFLILFIFFIRPYKEIK